MNTTDPDHAAAAPAPAERRRAAVQIAALGYGIVFVLVGIAGFIPGVTTNVGSIQLGGHHSEAMLIGLFQVSILHNIVHLLYGVAGIALASRPASARLFMLIGGALYLVLWVYGLAIDKESMANFVPLNSADDWLHFVLGVSMMGLSLLPRHRPPESTGRRHRRACRVSRASAASARSHATRNGSASWVRSSRPSPGRSRAGLVALPVACGAPSKSICSMRTWSWNHSR